MREKSHFHSCVISILVPVAFSLLLLLAGAIGMSMEESAEAYTVFIGAAAFMLVALPVLLLVCGIIGNVHGALALRDREPKCRSIIVLSISVLYTVGAVASAIALWIGLTQF